jgi:hypothetical protein
MKTKQATRNSAPPARLTGSPARMLEIMKNSAEAINRIQPHS